MTIDAIQSREAALLRVQEGARLAIATAMASRADAQEANQLVGIAARLVPWLSLARVANCCGIQGGGRGNIDVPPRD
eukprot:CAMPEP_0115489824 /NCGR_PEP_ID=MMETSP0271-20121206/62226_1 /TAXON_ID=71861 /ORGANISM="Scrippsiella trochoidea, Strain CCMP3099" /LENGTH=76 /DNA_ID=CAMNT_0002918029 /DNA_START=412 /DNA_END=639 /DNA_ORIENTATION=+